MTLSKSKLDKSIFLKTMSHTEEDVTAEMSLQIDGDGTGDDVLDVLETLLKDLIKWCNFLFQPGTWEEKLESVLTSTL